MPDRDARTVRELIMYQYSKIICKRAFKVPDGKAAKGQHYGFIKKTFRELKDGDKNWSDILREDWQFVDAEKKCVYCGKTENLSQEHIVPRSLNIKPECASCDTIQGIHNQIWACKECNSRKGTKGLYTFFKELYPAERKFYDILPVLLEKKYLKTAYECHQCAGTLSTVDANQDGDINVLDIDFIIQKCCV